MNSGPTGNPAWYIICNPAAGKGRAVKAGQRLSQLLDDHELAHSFAESEYAGHVEILVKDAVARGYTKFLSIGGDGTHHDVVNGIMQVREQLLRQPTLAVLNAGSGNDWSRTHGLKSDPRQCVELLQTGRTISHPAGLLKATFDGRTVSRYVINVAGMALDGRVVETYPELFRRFSFLPGYLLAGLAQLISYRAKPIIVRSAVQEVSDHLLTVHLGIGKYSGGGMQFVPHADPILPGFAVTCVRRMPKPRLFLNIYRLYNGSLPSHPRVETFRTDRVWVDGVPVPVEADGEFVAYTPLEAEFVEDAFLLVVP